MRQCVGAEGEIMKEKVNYYKQAPTWLFNLEGETELFQTQEEVGKAWEDGWFGPKGLTDTSPLLSSLEFETKRELIDAVEDDPRYNGLTLRLAQTTEDLEETLALFEQENDVKVE
jgi:hypothetical protein